MDHHWLSFCQLSLQLCHNTCLYLCLGIIAVSLCLEFPTKPYNLYSLPYFKVFFFVFTALTLTGLTASHTDRHFPNGFLQHCHVAPYPLASSMHAQIRTS